ncbi:MAG: DUF11 domain-containing protein [Gammaproteobacteria bacterium]|nr:DUF11 domain-containing protein [Gammaproteobacteria bacterium]
MHTVSTHRYPQLIITSIFVFLVLTSINRIVVFAGSFHNAGNGIDVPVQSVVVSFEPGQLTTEKTGMMTSASPNFCAGFESGSLEPFMSVYTTTSGSSQGRVGVVQLYPHSGDYALQLDTDCTTCSGYTTQAMIMSVDLASASNVVLDLWVQEHVDESHNEDGIFVSNNGGASYAKIYDFGSLPDQTYTNVQIDLDSAVANVGMSYTDGFLIKFQGFDNFPVPSDGYSIDDICLCSPPSGSIHPTMSFVGDKDVKLDWDDTPEGLYEVWYANNDSNFVPGDDCANPAPYQCEIVTESEFLGSNLRGHPDYNYTFMVLGRNVCGQRYDVSTAWRVGVLNFPLDESGIPANLALSIENSAQDITFSSAEIPINYTVHYTNTSSFNANNVVITQTLPAQTTFNSTRSTSGWEYDTTNAVYHLSLGAVPPGGSGTVVFAVDVNPTLPRYISTTAVVGDTQSPGEDPYHADDSDFVTNQLIGLPDNDNDGLPDWAETNNGNFINAVNAGTDPSKSDTDGDGIKDGDEARGTVDMLDLPAMGVSPLHKNILLEFDWFDDNEDSATCAAHSHRPTDAAITALTEAFANAPVTNPDGTTGIVLISDYGQSYIFSGGNLIPGNGIIADGVNGLEYQQIKSDNFASNRQGYFHYVLMLHRYDTNSNSSGQAEWPGNDLIVSLYCYHTDRNISHTVMHELGHNLGLGHGGNNSCNYKPNYNSVMNYKYQFPGVDNNCDPNGDGILDYSRGMRINLDETNLDERRGTCGNVAWDWNGNNVIEPSVSVDINSSDTNQENSCGGVLTQLTDYNDWDNLNYDSVHDFDGNEISVPDIVIEQPVPNQP